MKNGKYVTIRQAELIDAKNLLNTIKTYIPQSEFIPKHADEIKLSIEQEKEWINSFLINDHSLLLVAEYDNYIIGNIDLTGNSRKVMTHTAVIGMGMIEEWRNAGLGTALLNAIIQWAKNNPILEIIWLQVYTENILGMALYRKMGFVENGILKNFFKHENKYYDNMTMSMYVK